MRVTEIVIRLTCLISVLSFYPPNPCWAQADDEDRGEFELAQQLVDWKTAFVKGDANKIAAMYAADDDTLVILSNGKRISGINNIRQMYRAAFAEATFESIDVEELQIKRAGKMGCVTGRFKFNTVLKSDGSRWVLEIQSTMVFAKELHGWKIQLEHSSTIHGIPRLVASD